MYQNPIISAATTLCVDLTDNMRAGTADQLSGKTVDRSHQPAHKQWSNASTFIIPACKRCLDRSSIISISFAGPGNELT